MCNVELGIQVLFLISSAFGSNRLPSCNNQTDYVRLCRKYDNYTYVQPPKDPIVVIPSLDLKHVLQVDEQAKTLTVRVSILLEWKDDTVSVVPNISNNNWHQITNWEYQNVWNPDLQFHHVWRVETLPKYGSDETFTFKFNSSTNTMTYEQSMVVTFSCDFAFESYPFDESNCNFTFGCVSVPNGKFNFAPIKVLKENGKTPELTGTLQIANDHLDFDIKMEAIGEFGEQTLRYEMAFTGVTLILKRNVIPIGKFFVPTGCFAILSMISFFINPDVVPGRMGLLLTLFLISSNVYNSLKAPQKRGFSYAEVWIFGVYFPIILAVLEYGAILAWKKYFEIDSTSGLKIIKTVGKSSSSSFGNFFFIQLITFPTLFSDMASFFISSIFFLVFNIVYWIFL